MAARGRALEGNARGEQRGAPVGGTELLVAGVHQYRVAQLVVAAAGAASAATVGAHPFQHFLRVGHDHALHAFVMPDHRSPAGTNLHAKTRLCHRPAARVGIVDAVGAIAVVSPGQSLGAQHLCGHILNAGSKAVVHIREEVVALVPGRVGNVDGQSQGHCGVPDVAPALISLSQASVGSRFQVARRGGHHEIAYELRQSVVQDGVGGARVAECAHLVVLHERHSLVVDVHVVAEYADGDDTEGVAQSPVAPVVARSLPPLAGVLPRAVATAQEAYGRIVPHAQHPPAECLEVLALPALIVAHQLGGLRKLVAVETHGQALVATARYLLRRIGPCHEYAHGGFSTLLVVLYLPAQCVLVGHRRTAGSVDVVFAGAAAHDALHRIGLYTGLGIGSIFQQVVGRLDRGVAGGELCLDAVEVLLRVHAAGMAEAAIGVVDACCLNAARVEQLPGGGFHGRNGGFQLRGHPVEHRLPVRAVGHDGLCQHQHVLDVGNGSGQTVVRSAADGRLCLCDGCLQGGHVARRAVLEGIVQLDRFRSQRAYLRCRECYAI